MKELVILISIILLLLLLYLVYKPPEVIVPTSSEFNSSYNLTYWNNYKDLTSCNTYYFDRYPTLNTTILDGIKPITLEGCTYDDSIAAKKSTRECKSRVTGNANSIQTCLTNLGTLVTPGTTEAFYRACNVGNCEGLTAYIKIGVVYLNKNFNLTTSVGSLDTRFQMTFDTNDKSIISISDRRGNYLDWKDNKFIWIKGTSRYLWYLIPILPPLSSPQIGYVGGKYIPRFNTPGDIIKWILANRILTMVNASGVLSLANWDPNYVPYRVTNIVSYESLIL